MLNAKKPHAPHYRFGLNAEARAAWALRLRGWRILERRWSCRFGEIDLIARRGNMVIFVEVKARQDIAKALDSLTQKQWKRIEAAADIFMARHTARYNGLQHGRSLNNRTSLNGCSWRFDAICVVPHQWPKHFPAIWHP